MPHSGFSWEGPHLMKSGPSERLGGVAVAVLVLSARAARLLHALIRVPRAFQLAYVDDLADVVRVVGADVPDRRRPLGQLIVAGALHQLFQVRHHLVELLDGIGPLLVVELHKSFVIVAAEVFQLLSLQALEVAAVPEEQMIRKLPGRVTAAGGLPRGLLGSKSVNGGADGNEPLRLIVSSVQFVEKKAAQGGGLLVVLRVAGKRKSDCQSGNCE